jgi:hypothetical protein
MSSFWLPDESSRPAGYHRFWPVFRKTWVGGFLFMLVMFVIQCFGTAGEGRIVQKEVDHRLRSGLSHYFLLDSGQRLRVPPEVYDLGQPQQMVRKRRFSASYQVNGVWYSAWGGICRQCSSSLPSWPLDLPCSE